MEAAAGQRGGEKEEKGEIPLPEVGDFVTKVLRLSGLTVELSTADDGRDTTSEQGNVRIISLLLACIESSLKRVLTFFSND